MDKTLFQLIMEADEDLQAPDDNLDDAPEEPAADDAPPAPDEGGGDEAPPDLGTDDDLGFDDSGFDDGDGLDDAGATDEEEGKEAAPESLSEKASNILNQKLYRTFVAKNKSIEDIIENLQTIVPVLPYDIVKANDENVSRLKQALMKGQEYVVNNFVDAKYGENLSYYNKLDILYRLLLDAIDKNLKTFKQ